DCGRRRGDLRERAQGRGLEAPLERPHRRPPGGDAVTGEAAAQESLLGALEQLSAEVGVPLDELRRTVEEALTAAYRRAFEPPGEVTVRLQPETGEMTAIERTSGPDGDPTERPRPGAEVTPLAAH